MLLALSSRLLLKNCGGLACATGPVDRAAADCHRLLLILLRPFHQILPEDVGLCSSVQTSTAGTSIGSTRVQRFAANIVQYLYDNLCAGQDFTVESIIR